MELNVHREPDRAKTLFAEWLQREVHSSLYRFSDHARRFGECDVDLASKFGPREGGRKGIDLGADATRESAI